MEIWHQGRTETTAAENGKPKRSSARMVMGVVGQLAVPAWESLAVAYETLPREIRQGERPAYGVGRLLPRYSSYALILVAAVDRLCLLAESRHDHVVETFCMSDCQIFLPYPTYLC